jgi:hypothetical protein
MPGTKRTRSTSGTPISPRRPKSTSPSSSAAPPTRRQRRDESEFEDPVPMLTKRFTTLSASSGPYTPPTGDLDLSGATQEALRPLSTAQRSVLQQVFAESFGKSHDDTAKLAHEIRRAGFDPEKTLPRLEKRVYEAEIHFPFEPTAPGSTGRSTRWSALAKRGEIVPDDGAHLYRHRKLDDLARPLRAEQKPVKAYLDLFRTGIPAPDQGHISIVLAPALSIRTSVTLEDGRAIGTPESCVHVLLELARNHEADFKLLCRQANGERVSPQGVQARLQTQVHGPVDLRECYVRMVADERLSEKRGFADKVPGDVRWVRWPA